jgi:GR25 family glycosyltransferase involved in LPS biosynthesis
MIWNNFVEKYDEFKKYEYVLIIDSDLKLEPKNIEKTFLMAKNNKWSVCSWSYDEKSKDSYDGLYFTKNKGVRKTNFIEMCFMMIRQDVLKSLVIKWREINSDYSTGVDIVLTNVAINNKYLPFQIIDDFQLHNPNNNEKIVDSELNFIIKKDYQLRIRDLFDVMCLNKKFWRFGLGNKNKIQCGDTMILKNWFTINERESTIRILYKNLMGKKISEKNFNFLLNSSMNLYEIQLNIVNSTEFKNQFKNINPNDNVVYDNKLPIYIINLEKRLDKKKSTEKKLTNLGIKNFKFLKAVDGSKLNESDLLNSYNNDGSKLLNREMGKSEIGCSLSHLEVAKIIIKENLDYVLILEDDAELTLDFKLFLKNFNLNINYGFDFLMIGAFSSNEFNNGKVKKMLSPNRLIEEKSIIYLDVEKHRISEDITLHKPYYPSMSVDYIHGTHGYIMSKTGAHKLIKKNFPVVCEADNVWNLFHDEINLYLTNKLLIYRPLNSDSDIEIERRPIINQQNEKSKMRVRTKHPDFGF